MLIATKLQIPRVAEDYVQRPRLYAALERGNKRKLTLIAAPAGYGKSSLVASWLDLYTHEHVWISIDRSDSNLTQFLSYLHAGLQRNCPTSCARLDTILQGATLPPTDLIAANLLNDLDEIEAKLTVVLDDFHLIENPLILELVEALLQYLPRHIHIVMISREDPSLPLVQMRARQEMTEIRMEQLRFTPEEASIFMQQALGESVPAEITYLFSQRTEGWPVGMRLAVLSMHKTGDVHQYAARLDAARGGLVVDYLMAEVLEQTTPGMNEFMLKTSICDRLNVGLCDALIDNHDPIIDAQSHIDALMRTNLFVVELDSEHHWWRYHHLFQELLQHRLRNRFTPEEIRRLHSRAAAWYADNGFLDEAFTHLLAGGDTDGAVALLERHRLVMMNDDRWHVVEQWLNQLPEQAKQTRPELILARAWVAFYHHAIVRIPAILAPFAEQQIDHPVSDTQHAEVQFFQTLGLFWMGESAAAASAMRDALQRFAPSSHQVRGEAEIFYGVALQMLGRKDAAVQLMTRELYSSTTHNAVRKSRLLATLIFIHLLDGELHAASEYTRQVFSLARATNNAYAEAWTYYLEGVFSYAHREFDDALQSFQRAVEMRYVLHTRAAVDSFVGLALVYQALGKSAQADATLAQLREFAAATGELNYVTIVHSSRARLALMQGKPERAARHLQQSDLTSDVGILFFWLEVPRMTAGRVLTAGPNSANIRTGLEQLEQLRGAGAAEHNTFQLIQIDVLRAVGYQRLGQDRQAGEALDQALALATPGEWIQPFVDGGGPMADLLRAAAPRHPQRTFINRLLAAFPVAAPHAVQADMPDLSEPLTEREAEILTLLADRLTNQEIAAELVISVATVKRHVANVYQKLHVNSRRLAVAKAKALGQLPPSP
ncbi:MAG: hypothetical protein KDD83_10015 [Caldilineaceae bacterium]|nr:hypothetical protein [Caldilineaceae bacterium]